MTHRRLFVPPLLVLALAGCAHTTPHADAHLGDAVRLALAQQTLAPDAVRNPNPVAGMDGHAARAAILRYQQSFQQPAAQPGALGGGK